MSNQAKAQVRDYEHTFAGITFKGAYTVYDNEVGFYEGQLYADGEPIEHSWIRVVHDRGFYGENGLRDLEVKMMEEMIGLYFDLVDEIESAKIFNKEVS